MDKSLVEYFELCKDLNKMADMNLYRSVKNIDVIENDDSLEMVYKLEPTPIAAHMSIEPLVYKIIYSCVDGKWNKSKPIIGKYIPEQKARYIF